MGCVYSDNCSLLSAVMCMVVSRKLIECLDVSCWNLIVGWKEFMCVGICCYVVVLPNHEDVVNVALS